MEYYLIVLLVYLGTNLLAAWGLNLQFGVAGIANLAFILTIAAGAYAYAVFTLGPPAAAGNFQQYVGGYTFPFPVAVAGGAVVGAIVGVLVGVTGLKRLRQDYQAIAMLVVSLMAATVISADRPFLNGNEGLGLIPGPLSDQDPEIQRWAYVAIVAAVCVGGLFIMRKFTKGPIGRTLRAMRDDEQAALAVGKDVVAMRLLIQGVGGAFGGLSGALLVAFIGGWSPGAWAYVETLALLTAVIVGGMGSDLGVSIGTFLISILLLQGVQFLPQSLNTIRVGLREDLGWILLGTLTILFIWYRPQGVLPERRPRYGGGGG